ncbi:peptidase S24 [Desulfosporosinus sp. HMP52]|uniref:S24/S26 family peptidase n=1 Tax=Desulfosporosinus sp. HMP52 TaxID=1487923 RepID=UPI00051F9F10|nr:S24/S26 family peptidase [Desulfosporosinus sp. HMP52]KGK91408.1 peptidase S24 [Desulfosporosinus sp. HMP52]
MSKMRSVKSSALFPLITEILDNGQSTKISVSGNSMYPFLRDGIDSVELSKGNYGQLSRGDIVMVQRSDGSFVMHRVIKKTPDCFFMVGDAQQWIEGPLYPNQLVAGVTAIWRHNKRISCANSWLRLLSGLWLFLRPFRYFILKVYRRVRQLY